MDVLGGVLLWAGVFGAFLGLVALFWSRRRGLATIGISILLFVVGVYLPIRETRVGAIATHLDEVVPVFQWHEAHQIVVAASRERVDSAIRSVTPEEIRYFRTLTWLRRVAGPNRPGVLNPPKHQPILRVFTEAFRLAADEPGRELLLARKAERGAVLVQIGFNFRTEELDASHCRVTTETRVYTRGPHIVRGFAAYWRMIYPGSALIRRSWLRAIRERAENPKSDPAGLI